MNFLKLIMLTGKFIFIAILYGEFSSSAKNEEESV